MIVKNRTEWALNSLLDLFNSGELVAGDCSKCVVGSWLGTTHWSYDFCTRDGNQSDFRHVHHPLNFFLSNFLKGIVEPTGLTKDQWFDKLYEEKTPFTREELMEIENCFETNTTIKAFKRRFVSPEALKADQLAGLSAVMDLISSWEDKEVSFEEEVNKNKVQTEQLINI